MVGPTTDSPPITVRHLLSMAAGMVTDDVWADRHLDIADDGLDALVSNGATFSWPPHTHGEYSNLGYAMLGRVIRRVAGTSAQDFITDNLLRPLAMNRTTWLQPHHDDWARPYDVVDDRRVVELEPLGDGAIAPMGGLWSCVSDLARWVTWLDGAFPPRDDVETGPLCRASRREMQQVYRAFPTEHTAAGGRRCRCRSRTDRRRWLWLRIVRAARHPLRAFRLPLRRSAGLRVEHAVASRARHRRDRTGQRDLCADVGDGPKDVGDHR